MAASGSGQYERSPSLELTSYMRTAPVPFDKHGDLIIRTAQDTRYHVSSAILSFASPFFRNLPGAPPDEDVEATLVVPEQDATIEILLRLTYPIPDPVLYDLDDFTEAYVAAQKYNLEVATEALKKMLSRFTEDEPLRVYAIARRFGLEKEADIAANNACRSSPQDWPHCEEFEHITAAQYHELLQYHRRRGIAATQLLQWDELCPPCSECGKQWSKKWRKQASRMLMEAPTSDRIFSTAYVARFANDLDCMECSHSILQALRPNGPLSKLKASIDALPSNVVIGQSPVWYKIHGLVLTRASRFDYLEIVKHTAKLFVSV